MLSSQVPGSRNLLLCVPRILRQAAVRADEPGPDGPGALLRSSQHQKAGLCLRNPTRPPLDSSAASSLRPQVTSGGLAVYLSKDQEVWLESKTYVGMRGNPAGYSIFSGFLLHPQ